MAASVPGSLLSCSAGLDVWLYPSIYKITAIVPGHHACIPSRREGGREVRSKGKTSDEPNLLKKLSQKPPSSDFHFCPVGQNLIIQPLLEPSIWRRLGLIAEHIVSQKPNWVRVDKKETCRPQFPHLCNGEGLGCVFGLARVQLICDSGGLGVLLCQELRFSDSGSPEYISEVTLWAASKVSR